MHWHPLIERVIAQQGGVATRQQLLGHVPATVLDGYIGRRTLQRVFPHVYCPAGTDVHEALLLRAALAHAGPPAALSHTTALAVWGAMPFRPPVPLTIAQPRRRAGAQGLIAHRRIRFPPEPPQCVVRKGLPVTEVARSLIDSWPLLPPSDRRPLLLDMTRRGLTTPQRLAQALTERPNVGGHRALSQAIDLALDGCQSELEALGVVRVFRDRSLPRSVGQYPVDLPWGKVRLDRAWPEVKLAVELDGARHHTSPEDRQRDLARDAALAALGWVVLRFTYADVRRDPAGVRRRVHEVYAARARQLRVG